MPLVPMGPKDDPYKMFQSRPDQLPDWVSYDPSTDVLTIDGVAYARSFFTFMAKGEVGCLARIDRRGADGAITMSRVDGPSGKITA